MGHGPAIGQRWNRRPIAPEKRTFVGTPNQIKKIIQPTLIDGLLVLAGIVHEPNAVRAILPAVIADAECSSDLIPPARRVAIGTHQANNR